MRLSRTVVITAVLAAVAVAGGISRDAGATQQPVEMKFACALKSNGLMRYVSNLNQCKNSEEKVTIKPGPISLCVQPDGTVRKIPPFQCKKPGTVLTLPPASGTVYFCASNSTGQLRYVTSPAQCTSNEFPVFVTPNDQAPSVTSTSPANGATHVAVNTNITVNFSEPVTFSTSSFSLECPSGSPQSFGASGSGTPTIPLDPPFDLPAATPCTVTVLASGISDVDTGDPPDGLAANYVFSFTTADAAPSVTSTSPADGATHVAVNTNVVVNFSEPVTASGSSCTLRCPTGTPDGFTVSGSPGSSNTLDPTSALPERTVSSVNVIANQISDVDTV